jgi:hypothetical protein
MAVFDDLRRLAELDVVYLTKVIKGNTQGSTTIFRGRLREALNGSWIFNTGINQNGVAGIDLGVQQDSWLSSETPSQGLIVSINIPIIIPLVVPIPNVGDIVLQVNFSEEIELRSVIPDNLAD